MAKGKSSGGAAPTGGTVKKSKKPKFKGINHPKNLHKAWRSSGNGLVIRAYLGK